MSSGEAVNGLQMMAATGKDSQVRGRRLSPRPAYPTCLASRLGPRPCAHLPAPQDGRAQWAHLQTGPTISKNQHLGEQGLCCKPCK